MCATQWSVDQLVAVEPRTWAGINRPGGVARITKVHYSNGFVESLDVKYIIGGGVDTKLDIDFVKVHEDLPSRGRARRERDFYKASPAKRTRSDENEQNNNNKKKKKKAKTLIRKQELDCKTDKNIDLNKTPEATRKADENTDPKNKTSKATRKIHPEDSNKTKPKTEVVKFRVPLKIPRPCSDVLVPKDYECKVSPLAYTPVELRKKETDNSLNVSCTRPVTGNKSTDDLPAAKRVIIKKPSHPKSGVPVNFPLMQSNTTGVKDDKKPAMIPNSSSNQVSLKHVYDNQVHIANDFVDGIIGKPTASPFADTNKKKLATKTAVSLSPVNKEYVFNVPCGFAPQKGCANTIFRFFVRSCLWFSLRRKGLFVSMLSDAFNMNDNDSINKSDMFEKFAPVFKTKEVEDYLSVLANEGRIMISKDVVYPIF